MNQGVTLLPKDELVCLQVQFQRFRSTVDFEREIRTQGRDVKERKKLHVLFDTFCSGSFFCLILRP